jgi:hypothetical protein
MKANKNLTSLSKFVDHEFGVKGNEKRDKLEAEYEVFKLEVLIQKARQGKEKVTGEIDEFNSCNCLIIFGQKGVK